jgi:hypothetical protein
LSTAARLPTDWDEMRNLYRGSSLKKTAYEVGNPSRGLGQAAQICSWVKPVIYILFFIVLFNIK